MIENSNKILKLVPKTVPRAYPENTIETILLFSDLGDQLDYKFRQGAQDKLWKNPAKTLETTVKAKYYLWFSEQIKFPQVNKGRRKVKMQEIKLANANYFMAPLK